MTRRRAAAAGLFGLALAAPGLGAFAYVEPPSVAEPTVLEVVGAATPESVHIEQVLPASPIRPGRVGAHVALEELLDRGMHFATDFPEAARSWALADDNGGSFLVTAQNHRGRVVAVVVSGDCPTGFAARVRAGLPAIVVRNWCES